MKKKTIEQEYYVIERDGKMWGEEYDDGKCHCDGFIKPYEENGYGIKTPLEKVKKISENTKKEIDKRGFGYLTYSGNEDYFCKEIKGSTLRKVKVTTIIQYLD